MAGQKTRSFWSRMVFTTNSKTAWENVEPKRTRPGKQNSRSTRSSSPSMRLGALMEIPSIYIFTHDSIGVGEDGPTHQPVEQVASLRAMPNMLVLRPGDANEVVEAYKVILQHTHGPSTLVLTRQAMPTFDRTKYAPAAGVAKGG